MSKQLELERILYVDDEKDIRSVMAMTLGTVGGFNLQTCNSGQAALECIPNFKPQLILLDVMMPELDGPMTLLELRKLPESAEVPVIFVTAKVQTHEIKHYIDLGAIDVITKPFEVLNLKSRIQNLWNSLD